MSHYLPLLALNGTVVQLGIVGSPHTLNQETLILRRLNIAGSLVGGMKETQDCMDFCAKHSIVSNHEIIKADQLDRVYERITSKNDGAIRYVLDCQNS